MAAPTDNGRDTPDTDPRRFAPIAHSQGASQRDDGPTPARRIPIGKGLGWTVLIMCGLAAAVLVAVRAGAITLPGALPGAHGGGQSSQAGTQTSPAAQHLAADRLWASTTCTNILNWKNEIHHDATSLDLGLGALARIQDAIAATTRLSNQVSTLGLPPGAQTARAKSEIDQLRSDIQGRVHAIQGAASSVAGGNLAAIGTILSDLQSDTVVGSEIAGQLRHVLSVDLGLSLVETRACRQLVGIPI